MDLKEAAEMIVEVCRKLHEGRLVAAFDGNVSQRLSDGTVLATPTCVSKGEVTEDMLVWLDKDGNTLSDGRRASSEIKMHLKCYALRPDVGGVVHSHSPAASAFACAGEDFDTRPFSAGVMNFGKCVPLAPFALSGTDEVPESIAPFIKEHNAVLLSNHGALSVASTALDAFYLTETLENVAKTAIYLKSIGKSTNVPDDAVSKLYGKVKY